jgi:hypothetical protein
MKTRERKETFKSKHLVGEIYQDGKYLEKNLTWHAEDSPWKANQIYRMLLKNSISPKTICEVGCGAGETLSELSKKMPNTNFYGYELSPQAYQLCSSRATTKIEYKFENVIDKDVFYECLLCIDVFEHVEDYIGFIKAIQSKSNFKIFHIPLDISVLSVLRGGMMTARDSVGHLHYFTPETAIATLKDCGYEIIDSFFTTSFSDLPSKTIKEKMAKLPRKILFSLSPNLMVKMLGGCSLLVLTK